MVIGKCLLGIDLGTSSVKAVVINEGGELLTTGSREYPIHAPRTGWAEQQPDEWWDAVVPAVREAASHTNGTICAVGLSGQMHGTVLVQENGIPLGPAIIWADQRSAEEVEELKARVGRNELGRIAGTAPATGFMGPTLLWLRRHDPERLEKAAYCMLPKDYIRLKLTGRFATEASDASSTALFDVRQRDWSPEIITTLGLPLEMFPEVVEPAQIVGRLRKKQAEELSLPAGIPVVAGCADQVAQAVGNGLLEAGRGSVTVGSGGQILIPISAPVENPELNLHIFCHAPKNMWYVMGAILCAGLSMRWFRDLLALTDYPDAYEQLSTLAGGIEPCSDGLIFIPYLAGERSPLMDPKARGCFIGLTMRHTRAHLARAIMEGVAFALRQVMDTMTALQVPVHRLVAAGNGLESTVWRQIVSDILNKPLGVSVQTEQAGRGAALLAGIGAGLYGGYREINELSPSASEATEPDQSHHERYETQYRHFCTVYPALKSLFHSLH
jgi:xylulokinase